MFEGYDKTTTHVQNINALIHVIEESPNESLGETVGRKYLEVMDSSYTFNFPTFGKLSKSDIAFDLEYEFLNYYDLPEGDYSIYLSLVVTNWINEFREGEENVQVMEIKIFDLDKGQMVNLDQLTDPTEMESCSCTTWARDYSTEIIYSKHHPSCPKRNIELEAKTHIENLVKALEYEGSQGDGISEDHFEAYESAKSFIGRVKLIDSLKGKKNK